MRYPGVLPLILFGTILPCVHAKQPNILVLLFDDLGYSDLGCYGGEIRTPHIDALAKTGVRFESFYNSARCCPSRASLMTGLYPPQTGIAEFTNPHPNKELGPAYLGRLNDQCVTLAEVLKPAGYSCYYVGKWHLHHVTGPIERGFDEFFGFSFDHSHDQWDANYYERLPHGRKKEIDRAQGEFYATDVFNEYALEFIRQGQTRQQPWFLFLGHSAPHFPIQAPAEDADRYEPIYRRGWDVLRQERFQRMQEIGLVDGPRWTLTDRSLVPVDDAAIANGYPGQRNPAWDTIEPARQADLARRMALFAAMVEHVDRGLGQIVDHLKKTGQFESTLILILSDNGACYEWGPYGFDGRSRAGITHLHTGAELRTMGGPGTYHAYGSGWANLGNTPFRLYKHFTHEGGICAPFIASWPNGIRQRDVWIRERGHLIDVMPTLRAAAGAEYPRQRAGHDVPPEEGMNLLPVFNGESLPERTLYFEHQHARGLIQGDWKIVWGKRMPWEIEWEFYHLKTDRCETWDLAGQEQERVRELGQEWLEYAQRMQLHPFAR